MATILMILILAAPAAAHAHEAAGAHAHGDTLAAYLWVLVATMAGWAIVRARVRR